MASTVPAKSQPLHNFALPHLKWKKNHHSNSHHRGRCTKPDSASSPSRIDSPPPRRDDSASELAKSRKVTAQRRSPQNTGHENGPNGALASSPDRRSKILPKLLSETKGEESHEERKSDELQEAKSIDEEGSAEPGSKTWNLRPRKATQHRNLISDHQFKSHENTTQRNVIEPNSSERKKRQRFSIALSREEIEEDFLALTGSKPVRRPKKRAKGVQKQLDNLLPGLWLASITPDSYKVAENQQKV